MISYFNNVTYPFWSAPLPHPQPATLARSSDLLPTPKTAETPGETRPDGESQLTADPKTLNSDSTVLDALSVMSAGGYRHVPIMEEGVVIGVVSVTDVVDFLVIQFPEEILNPWFDIKPGDAYR